MSRKRPSKKDRTPLPCHGEVEGQKSACGRPTIHVSGLCFDCRKGVVRRSVDEAMTALDQSLEGLARRFGGVR